MLCSPCCLLWWVVHTMSMNALALMIMIMMMTMILIIRMMMMIIIVSTLFLIYPHHWKKNQMLLLPLLLIPPTSLNNPWKIVCRYLVHQPVRWHLHRHNNDDDLQIRRVTERMSMPHRLCRLVLFHCLLYYLPHPEHLKRRIKTWIIREDHPVICYILLVAVWKIEQRCGVVVVVVVVLVVFNQRKRLQQQDNTGVIEEEVMTNHHR